MAELAHDWRRVSLGWVRLCRLPNWFTVPGDPLLGFLAGGGAMSDARLPWLLGAVLLVYIFGLLDNDLRDLAIDRVERPGRPLPSGQVGVGAARGARWVLALGSLGAAAQVGWQPLAVTLLLLALALAYNRFKGYPPLGPALIGLCRVLAVAVGLSASPLTVVNPKLLLAVPMIWFFYLYGVGLVAAGEAKRGRVQGRAMILLVPLLWLWQCLVSTFAEFQLIGLAPGLRLGYAAATLAAILGLRHWLSLRGTPDPLVVQGSVGELIAGMILLQVSGCALAGAPHSGMIVAATGLLLLWLPCRWLGRRIPAS